MSFIQGQDRRQTQLFPESLEDYVGPDNPVRILDAFIDSLDLAALGFQRPKPAATGRPAYDPRILLKLYLYGYFNKIRSSRKLMQEAGRNVELFFLLNRLTPDFRTIADFRKQNALPIQNVFHTFSRLCLDLNLYQKALTAIDGSKFRAQNSKKNAYNKKTLNEKLERIQNHIQAYLQDLDAADRREEDAPRYTPEEIQEKLRQLHQRKEKYQGFLAQLKQSKETQLLTTDPEARVMQSKDGFHCSYNVQTCVDAGSHLVVDYAVTNHCTDQGLLTQMAQRAKKAQGLEVIQVVADRGYDSKEDILSSILQGVVPNVVLKYEEGKRACSLTYEEQEIDESTRRSLKPADIRKCLHAGVLPACYEGSCIRVEVQDRNTLSCFTKNPDGTVTCPVGKHLAKVKTRRGSTIYRSHEACRECANRCTDSPAPKEVSFGPRSSYVPVMMYGKIGYPLNPIPQDARANPFNHNLERKIFKEKIVLLTLEPDWEKMKTRMSVVEHPFGTVKWYHGAHYLLCRGREKAGAEIGLSLLVYNLKRAIKLKGFHRC